MTLLGRSIYEEHMQELNGGGKETKPVKKRKTPPQKPRIKRTPQTQVDLKKAQETPVSSNAEIAQIKFKEYGDPGKSLGPAKDPKARGSVQFMNSLYAYPTFDPESPLLKRHLGGFSATSTGSAARELRLRELQKSGKSIIDIKPYEDPGKSMGVANDQIARRSVVQQSGSLYGPLDVDPAASLLDRFHTGTAQGTGSSSRNAEFRKKYRERLDQQETPLSPAPTLTPEHPESDLYQDIPRRASQPPEKLMPLNLSTSPTNEPIKRRRSRKTKPALGESPKVSEPLISPPSPGNPEIISRIYPLARLALEYRLEATGSHLASYDLRKLKTEALSTGDEEFSRLCRTYLDRHGYNGQGPEILKVLDSCTGPEWRGVRKMFYESAKS